MAKYLLLWELQDDKIPDDAKARGEGWMMLLEMVKQDIKAGLHSEWGSFVGEMRGFAVSEGEPVQLAKNIQRFAPFVKFEVHQVMSADETMEVARSLT